MRNGEYQRLTGFSAVANWYNMDTLTASPTQINFMIAAPLFSLITIAYLELVPRFMPRSKRSPIPRGATYTEGICPFQEPELCICRERGKRIGQERKGKRVDQR